MQRETKRSRWLLYVSRVTWLQLSKKKAVFICTLWSLSGSRWYRNISTQPVFFITSFTCSPIFTKCWPSVQQASCLPTPFRTTVYISLTFTQHSISACVVFWQNLWQDKDKQVSGRSVGTTAQSQETKTWDASQITNNYMIKFCSVFINLLIPLLTF